jgi:putative ABC transport system permease protein
MQMVNLLQDVRYGIRMLAKNPGFTAVAVITLALGIGANTAIFSVINGVLLRPLPYKDPGRLVVVGESSPQFEMMSLSYPDFVDFQKQKHSFETFAAFNWQGHDLTGQGTAEHVAGKRVSADFFTVFGIPLVAGRNFDPKDDRLGTTPEVMVSEGLWKRRFNSAPDVVGKTVTMDGEGYTVVGIVPGWFKYFGAADVYTLLGQWDSIMARMREVHPGIHAVARLRSGVTIAQAQTEMSAIAAQLAQAYPKSNANHGATVRSMSQELVGDVRAPLMVLLGAVGFVLLIACANVANLLLARSTSRQKEMAIRAALGAGRSRVVRQLLTESVLLAGTGGVLGLIVAQWGTQAILAMVPGGLPRMENIGIDGWVLAFTLGVSILTGIIFGLAPSIQASRLDVQMTLREGARGSTSGHHGLRSVLVVSEIAASLVLLIGAGLMLRTMAQLNRVNPGFDTHNLLLFSLGLSPANRSTPDKIRMAYHRLTEEIGSLPGVQAGAVGDDIPLTGEDSEVPLWVSGRPRPATQSDMIWSLLYTTSPDYLNAMGIPLLKGRYFTDQDTKDSAGVVVIDEVMAKGLFPGEDPIGKSIGIADTSGEMGNGLNRPLEIVGVVGHVKHWGLDSDDSAKIRYQFYVPFVQIPDQLMAGLGTGLTVLVRTKVDPMSMVPALSSRVSEVEPDQPLYGAQTMQSIASDSLAGRRFSMLLLGVFAALALLLASVGIYGVISFTASQRTHEIGIRMALGAGRGHVLKLVVGQGLTLVVAGIGLGLAAAFGLSRLMAGMLYGVRPTDLVTFAAVSFVLAGVALLACYIPARRATKVDPMVALRYE